MAPLDIAWEHGTRRQVSFNRVTYARSGDALTFPLLCSQLPCCLLEHYDMISQAVRGFIQLTISHPLPPAPPFIRIKDFLFIY